MRSIEGFGSQGTPFTVAADKEFQSQANGEAHVEWAPSSTWTLGNGARYFVVYYQVLQNNDPDNVVRVRLQGSGDGRSWVNVTDLPADLDDIDGASNLTSVQYWPSSVQANAPYLRWGIEVTGDTTNNVIGNARVTMMVVPWMTDHDVLLETLIEDTPQSLSTGTGTLFTLTNSSLDLINMRHCAFHIQTTGVTGGSTDFSLEASFDAPDAASPLWIPVPSSPTATLDSTTTTGIIPFSTEYGRSFRVAYTNTTALTGTPEVDLLRLVGRT